MKSVQIFSKSNTQNFKTTVSFHGFHGNTTPRILVNACQKFPTKFYEKSFHQYSSNRRDNMTKEPLGGGIIPPLPGSMESSLHPQARWNHLSTPELG